MLDIASLTEEQAIDFQIELMRIQMSLEDSIHKLAKIYHEPAVLIMDRGLMDSAAFLSKSMWKRLR